jgi:superfamily II DNA/RNA helicase
MYNTQNRQNGGGFGARGQGGERGGERSERGGSSYSSRGGSRGGSSFGSRGGSRGGSRSGGFGGSRGGARPFDPKRSFKKDYIDEKLFINKAVVTEKVDEYVPVNNFVDFQVADALRDNIIAKGFTKPSPIQDQAIPVALTGRDVIGIASTGTGKTAALINKLVADRKHRAMVLAPTRELAQQIEEQFKALTKGMKLYSVSCVGGAPIFAQIRELSMGVHVVIGTPGRVKDLIERGKINVKDFNTVVLDEADRMLDMGFINDMRDILGSMPKEKQAMFFSATLSSEVRRLCADFLRDPVSITIKSRDTSNSVDQTVVKAARGEKIERLHEILIKPEANKVLIFREMKRSVDELARELKARGFNALALHGDMRNRERERAVSDLTTGRAQIVIATDVAARGIDIADISHVINYDLPNNYETYIHRIGRTGRANKTGSAITFV